MSWCQRPCQEPVSLTLGLPPFQFQGGLTDKGLPMGKIPTELRETIAKNIREQRMKKFPGRGGGKKCAEAFGVSPQQWSPWERGMRTPDEERLKQIADFFDVTVEYMRRDNAKLITPVTEPVHTSTPNDAHSPFAFPQVACSESDIIWQLHKVYTGLTQHGKRLHVSLNLVLSEIKEP